jgi:hypothetical protein
MNKKQYDKEYKEKHKEKIREQQRAYRIKNKEKLKLYDKNHYSRYKEKITEYRRNYIICTTKNGKTKHILVNKRPYTGICELCNKQNIFLGYHHWDDDNPACGLWLCNHCHQFAEGIDRGLSVEKYLIIKNNAKLERPKTIYRSEKMR